MENDDYISFSHPEGRYFILKTKLGQGSYGNVSDALFSVYDYPYPVDPVPIAVKIIKRNQDPKFIERELAINTYIKGIIPACPYLIHFYDYDIDQENVYIFMEKASGGTLVKNSIPIFWDDQKLIELFLEMAEAIRFLHINNIAHLDIKPANFILDEKRIIKLIDFGISCSDNILEFPCKNLPLAGTLNYIAPEIVMKNSIDARKADIFSLGVTFYYVALRFRALNTDIYKCENKCTDKDIIHYLRGKSRDVQHLPNLNKIKPFVSLIKAMTDLDQIKRLDIDDVIDELMLLRKELRHIFGQV